MAGVLGDFNVHLTWFSFLYSQQGLRDLQTIRLWDGLIRFKQHWRRSSHWSRICSAGDSFTLLWWYSGVMLASLNKAKFLLIKVLNKIHKCLSCSAVKVREAGGDSLGQRHFPLLSLIISSITLEPINGESKCYSVTRSGTFKSFL